MKKLFILDVAHGKSTPGKRSPDGKHREYLWSREICRKIMDFSKLTSLNIVCPFLNSVDEPGLSNRVYTYENLSEEGEKVMLSFHNNAQGMGKEWMKATGFSAYTSKGQTKSDKIAEVIINNFIEFFPNVKTRIHTVDGDQDYEENFTVLMGTFSQVLLEILFQDNINDVKVLASEEFQNRFVKMMIDSMLTIDSL